MCWCGAWVWPTWTPDLLEAAEFSVSQHPQDIPDLALEKSQLVQQLLRQPVKISHSQTIPSEVASPMRVHSMEPACYLGLEAAAQDSVQIFSVLT